MHQGTPPQRLPQRYDIEICRKVIMGQVKNKDNTWTRAIRMNSCLEAPWTPRYSHWTLSPELPRGQANEYLQVKLYATKIESSSHSILTRLFSRGPHTRHLQKQLVSREELSASEFHQEALHRCESSKDTNTLMNLFVVYNVSNQAPERKMHRAPSL